MFEPPDIDDLVAEILDDDFVKKGAVVLRCDPDFAEALEQEFSNLSLYYNIPFTLWINGVTASVGASE